MKKHTNSLLIVAAAWTALMFMMMFSSCKSSVATFGHEKCHFQTAQK